MRETGVSIFGMPMPGALEHHPGHTGAAFWDDGKAHEQRFIGGTKDPQMTNKQLNHIYIIYMIMIHYDPL